MNRLIAASSIVLVIAVTALLPGPGIASTARGAWMHEVPAGLAGAIHARLGAGTIWSSSVQQAQVGPANLGFSVALSADGTTALVGAPHVHHNEGAAYIFHASRRTGRPPSSALLARTAHPARSTYFTFPPRTPGRPPRRRPRP